MSVSGVVFKAGTWSLVRVRHLPGAARAGAMQGCADGGEECCTFTASAALVSCMRATAVGIVLLILAGEDSEGKCSAPGTGGLGAGSVKLHGNLACC